MDFATALLAYFFSAPIFAMGGVWLTNRMGPKAKRWVPSVALAFVLASIGFDNAKLSFSSNELGAISTCIVHFSWGLTAFCCIFLQKTVLGRVVGILLATPFLFTSWYLFGAMSALALDGRLQEPVYMQQLPNGHLCRIYEYGLHHPDGTAHISRSVAPGIELEVRSKDLGRCDGRRCIDEGASICASIES